MLTKKLLELIFRRESLESSRYSTPTYLGKVTKIIYQEKKRYSLHNNNNLGGYIRNEEDKTPAVIVYVLPKSVCCSHG